MAAKNVVVHYCDRCGAEIGFDKKKVYPAPPFADACEACFELNHVGASEGPTPVVLTVPQRNLIQSALGVVITNLNKAHGDDAKQRLREANELHNLIGDNDRRKFIFV